MFRRGFRPAVSRLEDRTLLATMLWTNAAGGDWDVASNWVNAADPTDQHVPIASDDAQINLSGITVTHSSPASDSVNSLTISASDATLNISNGSLALLSPTTTSTDAGGLSMSGGTLSTAGTLTVGGSMSWTGGTISGGGTLAIPAGATLAFGTSSDFTTETLDGVTLDNSGTVTVFRGNLDIGSNTAHTLFEMRGLWFNRIASPL